MRELSKKYSIKRKCAFWPIRTVLESFHLGQVNDEVHQSLAFKRPACPYDQVHILSPKDITCRASLRGTCDSAMIAWNSAVPTVEKSKSESLTCLSFVLFPITAVGMYNSGMCCISVFNSRSFYLKILRINLLLLLCVYAWYVCVGWVSVPGCVCVYVKGQLYYRVTSGFLPLRGFQGLIQVTRFVLHVPFWLYWCKVCTGVLCHIIKLMSCYMSKFCFHCFMIFFRNLSKKIGYYHTCLIFHIKSLNLIELFW